MELVRLVRLISIVALVANAAFADVSLLHLRSFRAQDNQNPLTPPSATPPSATPPSATPPSATPPSATSSATPPSARSKQAFATSNIDSMDAGQLRALLHEIISHSSESCLDEATSSASSSVSLIEAKAETKVKRTTCRVTWPGDDCCCGEKDAGTLTGDWVHCPDGQVELYTSLANHCCCRTSCFSAETNVTMADGSMKRIASLRAGERVRTVDGTATVVLAEQRETGGRNLFGFNHGIPFFTEEHIFITKKGPRALNPSALAKEDPSYEGISELVVGDELINPQGESVIIESIESAEKPFNTPVYNILLDTAHTYFANGHLVSDLFPRLDKFPFMFKLLHWLWRERSSQVDSFFINTLGRDGAAIELPTIHKDAEFAELFRRIKNTIDTFVEERS